MEFDVDNAQGVSPFSPPEAYSPPKVDDEIPYEEMHPLLQSFLDEHKAFSEKISEFEETIALIEGGKVDKDVDVRLRNFFFYFDEEIREHHLNEEKTIFPIVSKKMNEEGNHSNGAEDFNAIDVLEDEHIKSIQLAAVIFNLFALFSRIPDERSRIMVLDVAVQESKALVELLKVHIFREDTILFTYAHNNLSKDELTALQDKIKQKEV